MGWASMVVRVFSTFGMLASLIFLTAYSSTSDARVVDDQGTWKSTLQPRDLDGDLGNGYEAYFDTELNVTWLTDVGLDWGGQIKIAPLSGKLPEGHTDGLLYPLDNALGKWRLPYVEVIKHKTDGSSFADYFPYTVGYSEIGHLFQKTLGNAAACISNAGCGVDPIDALNVGPFLMGSYGFSTGIYLFPTESHVGLRGYHLVSTPWGVEEVWGFSYGPFEATFWPVFGGDIKNYPVMNPYLPPGVPEPDSMVLACLAILVAFVKARPLQGFLGARSV
jgi:hypothetical protein